MCALEDWKVLEHSNSSNSNHPNANKSLLEASNARLLILSIFLLDLALLTWDYLLIDTIPLDLGLSILLIDLFGTSGLLSFRIINIFIFFIRYGIFGLDIFNTFNRYSTLKRLWTWIYQYFNFSGRFNILDLELYFY